MAPTGFRNVGGVDMSGRVEHFSRRRFLVGTATAGAAAATMSTLSPRAVAAPGRSVAIFGADAAQPRHAQGLHRIDHDRVPDAVQAAAIRSRICRPEAGGLRHQQHRTQARAVGQPDLGRPHRCRARSPRSTTATWPTGSSATWPRRNPKTPARIRSDLSERPRYGRSCWATTSTTRVSTKCSTVRQVSSGLTRGWSISGQGVTFKWGRHSRLTRNSRHIASATVVDPNGLPQQVTADW